ncbi:hypothetical protein BU15DRAFT_68552 [Melanogaster broomeanus]|nr:hypothetical protein BU15DRAFT_68552 [Melanogaster broomeanus]
MAMTKCQGYTTSSSAQPPDGIIEDPGGHVLPSTPARPPSRPLEGSEAIISHQAAALMMRWSQTISLHELQKTLDAQGVEIVENQKENVLSRKGLAERTKEFKKIPDDEKDNSFKGLLGAYQQEIDNLTKRSKTAESAFLNVYKVLAEAPDPYPLLKAALEQTITSTANASLGAEVDTLKAEVGRLKGELRKENGTLDNTWRHWRGRLMKNVSTGFPAFAAADPWVPVTVYKSQLHDLRLSNETNQARLLDASSRADQDLVSRLTEADMVLADLERANSRVAVVEGRNEALWAEIEALRAESKNSKLITNHQSRLSTLESNNSDLTAQLLSTQAQLMKYHEEGAKQEEREVAELTAAISTLKKKLESYADYDEIKRELEIMKYVEFGGLNDDASDADVDDRSSHDSEAGLHLPDPNADKPNAQHGKSLEVLLASKNKRILEELTWFRVRILIHHPQTTRSHTVTIAWSLEESLRSTSGTKAAHDKDDAPVAAAAQPVSRQTSCIRTTHDTNDVDSTRQGPRRAQIEGEKTPRTQEVDGTCRDEQSEGERSLMVQIEPADDGMPVQRCCEDGW